MQFHKALVTHVLLGLLTLAWFVTIVAPPADFESHTPQDKQPPRLFEIPINREELNDAQIRALNAAEAGDPAALNAVGNALLQTRTVFGERNPTLALQCFEAAARDLSGSRQSLDEWSQRSGGYYAKAAIAAASVARMHATGDGVAASQARAFDWYKLAAHEGHQGALYNCGLLLVSVKDGVKRGNVDYPKDGPDLSQRLDDIPEAHRPILALEFFQAAYVIGSTAARTGAASGAAGGSGVSVSDTITQAALQAHTAVSEHLSSLSLPIPGDPTFSSLVRIWDASNLFDVSLRSGVVSSHVRGEAIGERRHAALSLERGRAKWKSVVAALSEFHALFAHNKGAFNERMYKLVQDVVFGIAELLNVRGDFVPGDTTTWAVGADTGDSPGNSTGDKVTDGGALSPLQVYLALDNVQDMVGPLAGQNDSYSRLAGIFAELLATHPFCSSSARFATREGDSACFNGAISSAVSYFRRAGDLASASRAVRTATRTHAQLTSTAHSQRPLPHTHQPQLQGGSGTQWRYLSQTPRVYHYFSSNLDGSGDNEIRAFPWWDHTKYALFDVLRKMYVSHSSSRTNNHPTSESNLLQEQLDAMIALREGNLRGSYTIANPLSAPSAVSGGDAAATSDQNGSSIHSQHGLERIFTPYIGVRIEVPSDAAPPTTTNGTEIVGGITAGIIRGGEERGPVQGEDRESQQQSSQQAVAWAEFGPLFDGVRWNEAKCAVVPLICDTIRSAMLGSSTPTQRSTTATTTVTTDAATGAAATTSTTAPSHSEQDSRVDGKAAAFGEEATAGIRSEICGLFPTEIMPNTVFMDGKADGIGEGHWDSDWEPVLRAQRRAVEERCGTDTVVTILRLVPGAHILPHCGTTNKRLIMHFTLRGAAGVEFRVGDDFIRESMEQSEGQWTTGGTTNQGTVGIAAASTPIVRNAEKYVRKDAERPVEQERSPRLPAMSAEREEMPASTTADGNESKRNSLKRRFSAVLAKINPFGRTRRAPSVSRASSDPLLSSSSSYSSAPIPLSSLSAVAQEVDGLLSAAVCSEGAAVLADSGELSRTAADNEGSEEERKKEGGHGEGRRLHRDREAAQRSSPRRREQTRVELSDFLTDTDEDRDGDTAADRVSGARAVEKLSQYEVVRDLHYSPAHASLFSLPAACPPLSRGPPLSTRSGNSDSSSSCGDGLGEKAEMQGSSKFRYEPSSDAHSGWVYSYGSVGHPRGAQSPKSTCFSSQDEASGRYQGAGDGAGDGGWAIVFDDSFEHEVVHRGREDRYVLLIVLNHPDVHYTYSS